MLPTKEQAKVEASKQDIGAVVAVDITVLPPDQDNRDLRIGRPYA